MWLSWYRTSTYRAPASYETRVRARARGACSIQPLICTSCPGWRFSPTRTIRRAYASRRSSSPTASKTNSGRATCPIVKDPEVDLDDAGVELRARSLAQAPQRLGRRQPLAVRPVGRHRVEGVANEDDPRLER